MKNYIYFALAAMVGIATLFATCANSGDADVQVLSRSNIISPAVDTITTSTSVDTVIFTLGDFRSEQKYELLVTATQLSGTANATCNLELNPDMGGNQWVSIDDVTVTGASTIELDTGSFLYGSVRCRCIAPSSTQSTEIYVDLSYTAD